MSQPQKEEIKIKESETEISWRAAEFRFVEKGPLWYFIIVGLGLVLVIFALMQRNFFFAIFVVLAGVTLIFFSRRRPKVIDFKINDEGVGVGKEVFYRYDDIESFYIYERPQQLNELILKRKAIINPYLRIPIDSNLAVKVKDLLSKRLTEVKYEPSIIDILADRLGF